MDLVALPRTRAPEQERLVLGAQLLKGLVQVDPVRPSHRPQQRLVVPLALDQVPAELPADGPVREGTGGIRDELPRVTPEDRTQPVAGLARADVGVEGEVPGLQLGAELEAARRAGAVGAVLDPGPALHQHGHPAVGRHRRLLHRVRDTSP